MKFPLFLVLLKSFAVACLVGCAIAQTAVNPCDVLIGTTTGILDDPSACENYFSCVGGIAFSAKCPSPLVYKAGAAGTLTVGTTIGTNEGVGTCETKTDVNCPPCRGKGITKVSSSTSCSEWILCIGTVPTTKTCAEGTLFNSAIGSCDLKKNVKCDIDPCVGITLATQVFVPNPVNSTMYHLCDFAKKKTLEKFTCASGTTFNKADQDCKVVPPSAC